MLILDHLAQRVPNRLDQSIVVDHSGWDWSQRFLVLFQPLTIEVRRCDVAAKLSGTSVARAIMCTMPRLFDGY